MGFTFQCLSQAGINLEVCGRKCILCKTEGLVEVDANELTSSWVVSVVYVCLH